MANPTIKIPIDTEAFDRFMDTFKKYQDALKAQPALWQEINETMGSVAAAGAAIAAEIARQGEETRKASTEENKRREAQRAATKEQNDALKAAREQQREYARFDKEKEKEETRVAREKDKRFKEEERQRKRSTKELKEYQKALTDSVAGFAKWAVIDTAIGGAAGLWGIGKLAQGASNERRMAQGYGVSIGQRQGEAINMQRYFDVNSTLENVANARTNPADWGAFRVLGLNANGPENNIEMTNKLALAARQMFINDKQNLGLANAQGLTKFFSPDALRTLAQTTESDLTTSAGNAYKFTGPADVAAKKWQDFIASMGAVTQNLKNKLIDKLSVLAPILGSVLTKLGEFALHFLDRVDFKRVASDLDGFLKKLESPQFKEAMDSFTKDVMKFGDMAVSVGETFGKYLLSDKFQTDLKNVADDIGTLAQKIHNALVFLGWIPDTPSAPTPSGVQSVDPKTLGGKYNYAPNSATSVIQGGNDVANQLMKWGWSENNAKGLLSNLWSESKLNPLQAQIGKGGKPIIDKKTGMYAGYGIAQWDPARQKLFADLFGHRMDSVKNPGKALQEQTEFMNWELTSSDKRNHFKKAGDDLKKEKGAFGSGYIGSMEYERPAGGRTTAFLRGIDADITVVFKERKARAGTSTPTIVNSVAGG